LVKITKRSKIRKYRSLREKVCAYPGCSFENQKGVSLKYKHLKWPALSSVDTIQSLKLCVIHINEYRAWEKEQNSEIDFETVKVTPLFTTDTPLLLQIPKIIDTTIPKILNGLKDITLLKESPDSNETHFGSNFTGLSSEAKSFFGFNALVKCLNIFYKQTHTLTDINGDIPIYLYLHLIEWIRIVIKDIVNIAQDRARMGVVKDFNGTNTAAQAILQEDVVKALKSYMTDLDQT